MQAEKVDSEPEMRRIIVKTACKSHSYEPASLLARAGRRFASAGTESGIKQMSETDSGYKVGPGEPPLHSRFEKGQSGNLRGAGEKKTCWRCWSRR
jgi:hypothetical protein